MKNYKVIVMAIGFFILWSCYNTNLDKHMDINHVVVIGFDGLSPDGIKNANTPTFDSLIKNGAYTFHDRAVLPTSSSSNWASMIMGAGPEQHGITSNAWEQDNFILPAVTEKEDHIFPTIFNLIDTQIPNAEIGAIYHWEGFGRLFEKNAVDYDVYAQTEDETVNLAAQYIRDKKPTFTFIHFDHVDHAGHEFGHGTREYYESVEKADKLLSEVLQSIKQAGINDNTLVIVSADHGGVGKGHGGESLKEIEIPFIISGKPVKKGYEIKYPVYQYDNAVTIAFVFNLKIPYAWIGKPVKMAFEGYDVKDAYPVMAMMEPPQLLPTYTTSKRSGGLFNEKTFLEIINSNDSTSVHYTLDGSMPTANSPVYSDQLEFIANEVVKAAVFKGGKIASTVSEGYYRIKPANYRAPVQYELFYLNNLSNVPELNGKVPDAIGTSFEITSDEIIQEIRENTAVAFKTNIRIEKEDDYTFYLRSDDGSKLEINTQIVVANDGEHGVTEKSGSIHLRPGIYPMQVTWFNVGGSGWLDVYYRSNSIPKQILPTTTLE